MKRAACRRLSFLRFIEIVYRSGELSWIAARLTLSWVHRRRKRARNGMICEINELLRLNLIFVVF
jgi:hypothetical protein